MRITTQMLNESAKLAGYEGPKTSLLDYVDGKAESSGNALLDALNKKNNTFNFNTSSEATYKKIQDSSDKLKNAIDCLIGDEKESIIENAKKSGNTDEIISSVKQFIEGYNSTIKGLKGTSSSLDSFYKQMLQELVKDDDTLLDKIGIEKQKDGSLKLDEDKIKKAQISDFEAIFGKDNSFGERISFVASHVFDNASVNENSASNQYDAFGGLNSSWSSKYDLWG